MYVSCVNQVNAVSTNADDNVNRLRLVPFPHYSGDTTNLQATLVVCAVRTSVSCTVQYLCRETKYFYAKYLLRRFSTFQPRAHNNSSVGAKM